MIAVLPLSGLNMVNDVVDYRMSYCLGIKAFWRPSGFFRWKIFDLEEAATPITVRVSVVRKRDGEFGICHGTNLVIDR